MKNVGTLIPSPVKPILMLGFLVMQLRLHCVSVALVNQFYTVVVSGLHVCLYVSSVYAFAFNFSIRERIKGE